MGAEVPSSGRLSDGTRERAGPGAQIWRFTCGRPAQGFVYFVMTLDGLYLKVGMSADWKRRLASLQTSAPQRLVLVAVVESDTPGELELWIHRRWRGLRSHREWFYVSGETARFVDSTMEGDTDSSPCALTRIMAGFLVDRFDLDAKQRPGVDRELIELGQRVYGRPARTLAPPGKAEVARARRAIGLKEAENDGN